MTETDPRPVDEPVHASREGVAAPQDNPTSDLTDADREWLDRNRALAQQYYGTTPVPEQPGVVTQPVVATDLAANQNVAQPPTTSDDESEPELDKSKPYYRLVHADGSETYQNGDLAIPTHGGDDGHAVIAAYLLPAENTDNK